METRCRPDCGRNPGSRLPIVGPTASRDPRTATTAIASSSSAQPRMRCPGRAAGPAAPAFRGGMRANTRRTMTDILCYVCMLSDCYSMLSVFVWAELPAGWKRCGCTLLAIRTQQVPGPGSGEGRGEAGGRRAPPPARGVSCRRGPMGPGCGGRLGPGRARRGRCLGLGQPPSRSSKPNRSRSGWSFPDLRPTRPGAATAADA